MVAQRPRSPPVLWTAGERLTFSAMSYQQTAACHAPSGFIHNLVAVALLDFPTAMEGLEGPS
jgi:hypothetical protein